MGKANSKWRCSTSQWDNDEITMYLYNVKEQKKKKIHRYLEQSSFIRWPLSWLLSKYSQSAWNLMTVKVRSGWACNCFLTWSIKVESIVKFFFFQNCTHFGWAKVKLSPRNDVFFKKLMHVLFCLPYSSSLSGIL